MYSNNTKKKNVSLMKRKLRSVKYRYYTSKKSKQNANFMYNYNVNNKNKNSAHLKSKHTLNINSHKGGYNVEYNEKLVDELKEFIQKKITYKSKTIISKTIFKKEKTTLEKMLTLEITYFDIHIMFIYICCIYSDIEINDIMLNTKLCSNKKTNNEICTMESLYKYIIDNKLFIIDGKVQTVDSKLYESFIKFLLHIINIDNIQDINIIDVSILFENYIQTPETISSLFIDSSKISEFITQITPFNKQLIESLRDYCSKIQQILSLFKVNNLKHVCINDLPQQNLPPSVITNLPSNNEHNLLRQQKKNISIPQMYSSSLVPGYKLPPPPLKAEQIKDTQFLANLREKEQEKENKTNPHNVYGDLPPPPKPPRTKKQLTTPPHNATTIAKNNRKKPIFIIPPPPTTTPPTTTTKSNLQQRNLPQLLYPDKSHNLEIQNETETETETYNNTNIYTTVQTRSKRKPPIPPRLYVLPQAPDVPPRPQVHPRRHLPQLPQVNTQSKKQTHSISKQRGFVNSMNIPLQTYFKEQQNTSPHNKPSNTSKVKVSKLINIFEPARR